ncbi:hypothetical protein AAH48_07895, partial [Campylobacter lari]|nr:hypothetical protein [Campylobacter lari]
MKKKGYCFIQSIGSKNHWDLAFLGYNLDKSDSYTINRNLYSKREIILHKKKILAKLKNELRDSNVNNIIFSSELLHSRLNSKREIRRLRRILLIMGISDVRIICYIRHPFEMLPSLYSEALKRDELNEIKLYEINASINYSDGYKKKLSHFAYICNYKNSLQKWISVFNKDKIIVRLFDKNEFYQGDLLKDFILCIKLQWDVNFLVPTLQNKSLNLIGIELLRRINKILPQYMFYKKNNYRGDIVLFIQKHFSFSDSQLKFYPTKKDMYYFCEYFKKSNEWIRKEFFPLKKNIFYDDKILSYQENDKLKTIDSRYLSQIVNFIVDIIVHKNIDIINIKNSIKEKDDAILKHKSHINSIEYILSKNKIEIIRIQNLNNTLNQTIKEKDNIINSNINHINQLQSNIQEKSTQLNQIQSKLSFQT